MCSATSLRCHKPFPAGARNDPDDNNIHPPVYALLSPAGRQEGSRTRPSQGDIAYFGMWLRTPGTSFAREIRWRPFTD